MDGHQSDDTLIDAALDRDLEAALAVDPSPEFVARVRMRVQAEPARSWSVWPWGVAAAAIVIAALAVGRWPPNGSTVSQRPPVAQNARPERDDAVLVPDFSPAPRADAPTNRTSRSQIVARPGRATIRAGQPELLIEAEESRALHRLFADVRKGLVDLSSLQPDAPAAAALQPPGAIAFQPITFEPIVAQTVEEGERQ